MSGGGFRNEFSWSWSRHGAFRTCRRQYWLQHYGSWGGWKPESPAREIYLQRKLVSQPQWIGISVHSAIEWVLKRLLEGRLPERETVVERFTRVAQRQQEDSSRGLYRIDPKRFVGFYEHYYEQAPTDDFWVPAVDEMGRQLGELYDNRVFKRLCDSAQRIVEVEQLKRVWLEGVPVWVSLDVLVRDKSGAFVVIDWKTGQSHVSEDVRAQLGIYGHYVSMEYLGGEPSDQISAMQVNTRSGEHQTWHLGPDELDQARRLILTSAQEMRSCLENVDENRANKADFPMAPMGSPHCGRCRFKRTCER